jgi:hypothetical protein
MLGVDLAGLSRYVSACVAELSPQSRQARGRRFTRADVEVLARAKARANGDGELIVTCAWCGAEIGSHPGFGVCGASHGMCSRCSQAIIRDHGLHAPAP